MWVKAAGGKKHGVSIVLETLVLELPRSLLPDSRAKGFNQFATEESSVDKALGAMAFTASQSGTPCGGPLVEMFVE
ncbi:hypothetical protein E2542_SST12907 [Spatholobus suberectus]|nr:hypothetical protein E2542_SST12907 [Spatholobus suberectus]